MTRLEIWRRSSGLTLDDLAKRLGPGFTAGVLSLLEQERLRPSLRQRARLELVVGIGADELLAPVTIADTLIGAGPSQE